MICIGIGGVLGRMGQAVAVAAQALSDVTIVGGIVRRGSAAERSDRRGYPISSNLQDVITQSDVFVDFSSANALADHLRACVEKGVPYLSGVTGLDGANRDRLTEAAAHIPVFYASNFSVGVTVVTELVSMAAAWMPEADVEVVDLHHQLKRDAPSGTALSLVAAVEAGRAATGGIGVHSLRAGGNAGEHRVLFASEGEEVWISHRALSRATFAEGALQAARWLADKPPGRYGMKNMLSGEAGGLQMS